MNQGLFGRLQSELEEQEKVAGFSMADVLALPNAQRKLILWMIKHRQTVTLSTLADGLGESPEQTQIVLGPLIEQGLIRAMSVGGSERYKLRFARTQNSRSSKDIWQTLDKKLDD
jgi:DNA-binding transcriptional ArsR family regulator